MNKKMKNQIKREISGFYIKKICLLIYVFSLINHAMKNVFPLFNTPIDLAHSFWEKILDNGDIVIDATCGNGKDSLKLSLLLQKKINTSLFCLDIQEIAIAKTKKLIEEKNPEFIPNTHFFLGSHEEIEKITTEKCKLIVYNLGYLPSGDKSVTTVTSSTLKSISQALNMLVNGGVISITCYPGHEEGKKEKIALYSLLSSLDAKNWSVASIDWENRNEAPSLLLVQKNLESDKPLI